MTINTTEYYEAEGVDGVRHLKPGCRLLCRTTGHPEDAYVLLRILLRELEPRRVISSVLPDLKYCKIIGKTLPYRVPKHPVVSWEDAVETTQKLNDGERSMLVFYDFTKDPSTSIDFDKGLPHSMESLPDIFVNSPNISLVLFMPPPVFYIGGLQFCLWKADHQLNWNIKPIRQVQSPTPTCFESLQPGCRVLCVADNKIGNVTNLIAQLCRVLRPERTIGPSEHTDTIRTCTHPNLTHMVFAETWPRIVAEIVALRKYPVKLKTLVFFDGGREPIGQDVWSSLSGLDKSLAFEGDNDDISLVLFSPFPPQVECHSLDFLIECKPNHPQDNGPWVIRKWSESRHALLLTSQTE